MAPTLRAQFGLTLLGYDLILDRTREWKIVEVNSIPAGLHLATAPTQFRTHGPSVYTLWARRLRRIGATRLITLVKKGAFRESTEARQIIVRDVNFIHRRLKTRGLSDVISPNRQPYLKSTYVVRRFNLKSRNALRQAANYSPIPRIQYVCANKHFLAEAYADGQAVAPSFIDSKSASIFAQTIGCLLVAKPQYGMQSWGVERIECSQIQRFGGGGFLFQEWLESVADCSPGKRQFDVRVFVLGSRMIGIFARVAPAIKNDLTQNSPLSWLTSLGAIFSVTDCPTSERSRGSHVVFPREDLHRLQLVIQSFQGWLFKRIERASRFSSIESLHLGIGKQYWSSS